MATHGSIKASVSSRFRNANGTSPILSTLLACHPCHLRPCLPKRHGSRPMYALWGQVQEGQSSPITRPRQASNSSPSTKRLSMGWLAVRTGGKLTTSLAVTASCARCIPNTTPGWPCGIAWTLRGLSIALLRKGLVFQYTGFRRAMLRRARNLLGRVPRWRPPDF